MKKSLETSEWVLSFTIIVILGSLIFISRYHDQRKCSKLAVTVIEEEKLLEISITGDVAKPGVFQVPMGTRLGDIIKKSRPNRFADLTSYVMDEPVGSSVRIEIQELKEIVVRIEGAVEVPLEIVVPAGSRICDLKSKVQLAKEADLKFFKRRRMLKHREIIVVPSSAP